MPRPKQIPKCHPDRPHAAKGMCHPCWAREYNKGRDYTSDTSTWRRNYLKSEYGLTVEAYKAMLEAQNGVCALCLRNRHKTRHLCVDHNHKNGKVRGILCNPCNRSLGLVEDTKWLERAISYLAKGQ